MEIKKRTFTGEIKGINEDEKTLTAYISTKARDRMDESLLPEGADLKKYNQNPVVLFAHDYSRPPIGKALWTKKDGKGILSKVQFANTPFAKEIFELFKGGFMNAFSVGFMPKEWVDGDGKKTPARTYTKWEMLEYSAVPVPANPEALALAMQKGILTSETLIKELQGEEQEGVQDEEKPEQTEETTKEETVSEDKKDEGTEAEKPEEENAEAETTEDKGLDEISAYVDQLEEKVKTYEEEIKQLHVELYTKYTHKENCLLGMTDSEIAEKIGEIAVGVIRQAQGKVK